MAEALIARRPTTRNPPLLAVGILAAGVGLLLLFTGNLGFATVDRLSRLFLSLLLIASGLAAILVAVRARTRVAYLLLIPGGIWLTFFYLIPMARLAATSLQEGTVETGFDFVWKWSNFSALYDTFGAQFIRSFVYAGLATAVALVISYPLAYFIAFRTGRWKNLFLVLIVLPFLVPFLLRTLAWKIILADDGLVLETLKTVGLVSDNGKLLATAVAVVAGITYNFLPFMTLPIYVSLEKIDRSMLEAAADLYANPALAFWKVTWPLSRPGVVAGTLLTLIPAAGDYVNAQLLGAPQQFMIGNVIQSRFLVVLDYPVAAALSFTLLLAILALVIPYVRATGTEELAAA